MKWAFSSMLHLLLWIVIPNDLERLDGMLVWLTILLREHCEHTRLVQHYGAPPGSAKVCKYTCNPMLTERDLEIPLNFRYVMTYGGVDHALCNS